MAAPLTTVVAATPLRSPTFAAFWAAQAVSRFGDPITLIALTATTFRLTGSALATTLAVLVATIPQATFGFIGGSVADAVGHRRAMIVCDILRALAIALVPVSLALGAPLAVAFALVFVAGLCAAVFNPARISLVPTVVSQPQLVTANSLLYATDRVVEIIGALAGGLLVAFIGDAAFYVDAVTFAISALLLTRVPRAAATVARMSWARALRDVGTGIRYIRSDRILYANTLFSLAAQLSIPIFNGLLPVLIFREFARGDAQAGAQLFGVAEAMLAAGAVAAASFLLRPLRTLGKGRLAIIGFAVYGAAVAAVAAAGSIEALLFAVLVVGAANVVFFVANVSIAQEATPEPLRARVFGARMSLLSLSWLPVMAVAGVLADRVPPSMLLGAAGLISLAIAAAAWRVPVVRDVK